MSLRDAVTETVEDMTVVLADAIDRKETTIPLMVFRGYVRELAAACAASEQTAAAAPAPAPAQPAIKCAHLPRGGYCHCANSPGTCPVCGQCLHCHAIVRATVGSPMTGGTPGLVLPGVNGAPPKGAIQAEERYGGGLFECVGGILDGTHVTIDAAPVDGGKTILHDQVYVYRSADKMFHFSETDTAEVRTLRTQAGAEPPAEKKLIIPGSAK